MSARGQPSVGYEFPLGWEAFDVTDLAGYDHGGVEVYARHGHEELRLVFRGGVFGDLNIHALGLFTQCLQHL